MGGIRRVNTREVDLEAGNVSATVPPHAPVASAVIKRYVAPAEGRVKSVSVAIAVAGGTPGGSADFKQVVRCRNAGFAGTGTDLITEDIVLGDWSPDDLPAAGTVRSAYAKPVGTTGLPVRKGQVIDFHYLESGTIGTATRATFNIVGVIFEAVSHVDPATP